MMNFILPCWAATPEEIESKRINANIEKQLERDKKFRKREVKILLLGAGESGKSTIFKQMKIIHMNGFTKEELLTFRDAIYSNILAILQAVFNAMKNLEIPYENPEVSMPYVEKILAIPYMARIEYQVFANLVVPCVKNVLQDRGVQSCIERSREYYLLDSAPYYFENIDRMNNPGYIPSIQDVLRVRVKTTGIADIRFDMGHLHIHMFDVGGQRSERKKWIHSFENITCLIFCVALNGYNQQLVEDMEQNRMLESLLLFEQVISSQWFAKTSVILFLNMTDLFKEKLAKYPLNKYFPEYTGGNDFAKAAEFIQNKFISLNKNNVNIYCQWTCATDTDNMKFTFTAIKEIIMENNMKHAGLL